MKEILVYRSITTDSVYINNNNIKRSYDLYKNLEESKECESVQKVAEKEIIRFLVNKESFRNIFFEELNISNKYQIKLEQIRPFYNKNEGEIDIILYSKFEPNKTISIECKRINEKINNETNSLIIDRDLFKKVIVQGNRNRNLGFFQNYICFIIEVDDSKDLYTQPMFKSAKDITLNRIIDFPGRDELHESIGIIIIEIIQNLNKSFKESHIINLGMLIKASKQEQLNIITEIVKKL